MEIKRMENGGKMRGEKQQSSDNQVVEVEVEVVEVPQGRCAAALLLLLLPE